MRVTNAIRERLTRALTPERLEVIDESAAHAGHAGARTEGESHFCIIVVTEAFRGLTALQRQRRVYHALGDLMRSDIHALRIVAQVPHHPGGR